MSPGMLRRDISRRFIIIIIIIIITISLKLVFRSLKGRCHSNRFLLHLSTELMDVAARKQPVAQPGGLTSVA